MIFRVANWFDVVELLFWNVALGAAFHVGLLIVCIKRPPTAYSPDRARYCPKRWERGGRVYKERWKIHLWKEKVPQFVRKDGFSKEHLETQPTIAYVDLFLVETCRGEWYHSTCLWMAGFVVVANPIQIGWLFSLILLLVHLPCKAIQRYNRFRLQILRKKLLREAQRACLPTSPEVREP